jgi:hypothetical protein
MTDKVEMLRFRYLRPDGTVLFTWEQTSQMKVAGWDVTPHGRIRISAEQWFDPPWILQRCTENTEWVTVDEAKTKAAITHIAGLDITWNSEQGPHLRQRCAWCGATLIDMDLSLTQTSALIVPGRDNRPKVWAIGALVTVDGDVTHVASMAQGAQMPPDACTRIDAAVTT